MTTKIYNVLFLCTGNSARSILAEKLLDHCGKGRFKAFSAGSFPSGRVNPFAIDELQRRGLPTDGCEAKAGMNLTSLARQKWILFLLSATTPLARFAPSGRAVQ